MIGQIVMKWQPSYEIEDGGDRHPEFLQYAFPTSSIFSSPNVSNNFGDDGSSTTKMPAVFRNSR